MDEKLYRNATPYEVASQDPNVLTLAVVQVSAKPQPQCGLSRDGTPLHTRKCLDWGLCEAGEGRRTHDGGGVGAFQEVINALNGMMEDAADRPGMDYIVLDFLREYMRANEDEVREVLGDDSPEEGE